MTALAAILGYALGSLPAALLVTRTVAGIDPRQAGTGNAGATNAALQAGVRAGLVVFALDLGKGSAAAALGL
ncbi:MAG: glycerol-3-phosphate acyltransferase, partial [Candidatus Limnocylindria bacterium]